jgi:tRNA(Ile)-lysidine synthase
MLKRGEIVIVAVSGGADSIALLEILEKLSMEYEIQLVVGHLNHGIRCYEADRDEKFVELIAKEKGLPFESKYADIPSLKKNTGRSIEDIAREERYQFLLELAGRYKAQKIALGHNLHDQVETVILNLLRGSGPEGLRGMLPVRDGIIIRPLLFSTREEITAFLKKEQLRFVEDKTNEDKSFLRNRIRHNLIPTLKQYNPNVEINLSNMSNIMRLENECLNAQVANIFARWELPPQNKEVRVKTAHMLEYPEAIQNRIIKRILHHSSGKNDGFSYVHVNAVKALLSEDQPDSTVLSLPFGIKVRKKNGEILFNPAEKEKNILFEYDVHFLSSVNIKELGIEIKFDMIMDKTQVDMDAPGVIYMDHDEVKYPLKIRNFRCGDRIQPLGMSGTKKVKAYFIDKKIPLLQRREVPLLLDQDSIVGIAGLVISDRVKIKEKTKRILRVEIV